MLPCCVVSLVPRLRPVWRPSVFVRQRRRCSSGAQDQDQDQDLHPAGLRALVQLCVDRFYLCPGQTNIELFQRGLSCSYGPLGLEFRRNLLDQWWYSVSTSPAQVFGLKTLICSKAPTMDGAGQLGIVDLEKVSQVLAQEELSREELIQQLRELLRGSPSMRRSLYQGALEQFVPSLQLVARKLPFGLAETGLCFQPPGGSACPGEATNTSLVWFCSPRSSGQWLDHWTRQRLKWWRKFALSPSNFSSVEVPEEEREEVVSRGVRIFYGFPWGQKPIETLWLRGNAELLQTHKGAHSQLQGRDGRRTLPHVVTVTANLDCGMLAFLSNSLQQLRKDASKHRLQHRQVLKLHPALAPVKVALEVGRGATAELRQLCEGLMQEFTEAKLSVWPGYLNPQASALEQLNAKYDEMGVLFTVLISEDTLENGLLQVRSRDTTIKETVHVSEARNYICKYVSAARHG